MLSSDAFAGGAVLITGGAGGIGAACARLFARCGVAVAVADQDAGQAAQLAAAIEKDGGRAAAFQLDVTDADEASDVVARAERALGPVDVLVNNAGIAEHKTVLELSLEEWRRVLDVNLTGAFICAQAVARRLTALERPGSIVNVTSVAGLTGVANRVAYVASKHGLAGLTKVLALDLAEHRIRVNAVAPGAIETPLTASALARPQAAQRIAQRHALGRWGQPEEVADLVVFLSSRHAAFMTGVVAPVDGGFLAGQRIRSVRNDDKDDDDPARALPRR